MRVPGLTVAVVDLREADPAFSQPAGQQTAVGEVTAAIKIAHLLRFPADVEGIAGGGLHAEGRLHCVDASLEGGVMAALCGMLLVQTAHQVELAALLFETERTVTEEGQHL